MTYSGNHGIPLLGSPWLFAFLLALLCGGLSDVVFSSTSGRFRFGFPLAPGLGFGVLRFIIWTVLNVIIMFIFIRFIVVWWLVHVIITLPFERERHGSQWGSNSKPNKSLNLITMSMAGGMITSQGQVQWINHLMDHQTPKIETTCLELVSSYVNKHHWQFWNSFLHWILSDIKAKIGELNLDPLIKLVLT